MRGLCDLQTFDTGRYDCRQHVAGYAHHDCALYCKQYDSSYNNYKDSDIRAWLNATFYEEAFSELQRNTILTTTVDNSAYSTGDSLNKYACEDTEDKIFLLSYREVTNADYGFATSSSTYDAARRMQTSDYTRATGASTFIGASYYGNGSWWLRSPYSAMGAHAQTVSREGYKNSDQVSRGIYGVVPALQIRL